MSGLIGNLKERDTSNVAPPPPPTLANTSFQGFPKPLHRSLQPHKKVSAFKASRATVITPRPSAPPVVVEARSGLTSKFGTETKAGEIDDEEISRENEEKIRGMSLEEIMSEREELLERFGSDLLEAFRTRATKSDTKGKGRVLDALVAPVPTKFLEEDSISKESEMMLSNLSATERIQEREELVERFGGDLLAKAMANRRLHRGKGKDRKSEEPPSKRAVRFSDVLSTSSLEQVSASSLITTQSLPSDPSLYPLQPPTDTSALNWTLQISNTLPDSNSIRFGLDGQPIALADLASLPTHLGLHHHGDAPELAGYTYNEIIHLSRSTQVSQRIGMMGVLTRVVKHLKSPFTRFEDGREQIEDWETKALDVGILAVVGLEHEGGLALGGRGSNVGLVSRGVDLLWEVLIPASTPSASTSISEEEVVLNLKHLEKLPLGILASLLTTTNLPQHPTKSQIIEILSFIPVESFISSPSPDGDEEAQQQRQDEPEESKLLAILVAQLSGPDDTNPQVLKLLNKFIQHSRLFGDTFLAVGGLSRITRFIVGGSATVEDAILCKSSLDILTSLAAYGLSSNLATTLSTSIAGISTTISTDPIADLGLTKAFYNLLKYWTVCSIDPHMTTPPHEITWSQVVGLGWMENALEVYPKLITNLSPSSSTSTIETLTELTGFINAWIEGTKVNGLTIPRSEIDTIFTNIHKVFRNINDSVSSLASSAMMLAHDPIRLCVLLGYINQAVRLVVEGRKSTDQDIAAILPADLLVQLADHLLQRPTWAKICSALVNKSNLLQHATSFLSFSALQRPLFVPSSTAASHFIIMVRVVSMLIAGDEDQAQKLFKKIFSLNWEEVVPVLGSEVAPETLLKYLGHRHGMYTIETLYLYMVSQDDESDAVAPLIPSPTSLRISKTLNVPKTPSTQLLEMDSSSRTFGDISDNRPTCSGPGLPLPRNWTYSPIPELLQSSSSKALTQVPPDWDASETELVRQTLLFAKCVAAAEAQDRQLGASEITFELMRVFMLEQGMDGNAKNEEVFRDAVVNEWMEDLLKPFTYGSTPAISNIISCNIEQQSSTSVLAPLEATVLPYLGTGVPFFQFYTDFIALYDSISFSHKLFGQLLLPPISQTYQLDYRKLLWGEYPHILRMLRLGASDVILEEQQGISSYLWPNETDQDMLGLYLKSLIQGNCSRSTTQFLYLVAVHHIAAGIWNDFGSAASSSIPATARQQLVQAVIVSAPSTLLQDIFKYSQPSKSQGAPWTGVCCFEGGFSEEVRKERVALVGRSTGTKGLERLRSEGLL